MPISYDMYISVNAFLKARFLRLSSSYFINSGLPYPSLKLSRTSTIVKTGPVLFYIIFSA